MRQCYKKDESFHNHMPFHIFSRKCRDDVDYNLYFHSSLKSSNDSKINKVHDKVTYLGSSKIINLIVQISYTLLQRGVAVVNPMEARHNEPKAEKRDGEERKMEEKVDGHGNRLGEKK